MTEAYALAPLLYGTLLAALLSLDRTALGQVQVCRPLVAATALGFILGDPGTGATVGIIYELLFLYQLPVGSTVPYHPMLASLLAVHLSVSGRGLLSHWTVVPAAVLIALPAVVADRQAMILWRRSNWRIMSRAEAYMRLGRIRRVRMYHLAAVASEGLYTGAVFLLSALILLPLFRWLLLRHPAAVGLMAVAGVLPFYLGLSSLVQKHLNGSGWARFAAGVLSALILSRLGVI